MTVFKQVPGCDIVGRTMFYWTGTHVATSKVYQYSKIHTIVCQEDADAQISTE